MTGEEIKAYRLAKREKRLAQRRAWRAANAAKVNAQNKALRDADPEKYRRYRRKHYLKFQTEHQERARNKQAVLRATRPEHARKLRRRWYQRHPERAAAQQRRWRLANQDRVRANFMRRRAAMRATRGDATKEQITARVQFFGGVCSYCGGPYEDIDHAIPISRGGTNWPANLRPACDHCNSSKGAKTPMEFLAWRKKNQP